jgi:hypothetical protein
LVIVHHNLLVINDLNNCSIHMKYIKRIINNFLLYTSRKYYMDNHPDGKSYPPLKNRLRIFWKLRNEPTIEERWAMIRDFKI